MYENLLIYAKQRGTIPFVLDREGRTPGQTYLFDLTIKPTLPLRVGMIVRIHEIKHNPNRYLNPTPPYEAESTGIVGTITGIRAMEKEIIELVLVHQDSRYATHLKNAYITVPYIPGVTVELTRWESFIHTLLYPYLQSSREIFLEENAVVIDNINPRRDAEADPEAWD